MDLNKFTFMLTVLKTKHDCRHQSYFFTSESNRASGLLNSLELAADEEDVAEVGLKKEI